MDKNWREDVQIAKDLCYPAEVIRLLRAEPNPDKRSRILTNARRGFYDKKKK